MLCCLRSTILRAEIARLLICREVVPCCSLRLILRVETATRCYYIGKEALYCSLSINLSK
jgi:hypothetical protein